uniref:Uncharacterized protein n=1 Tax=Triticum urartu TaxID=4572 RepID=A0A8R7QQK6_TRIUA
SIQLHLPSQPAPTFDLSRSQPALDPGWIKATASRAILLVCLARTQQERSSSAVEHYQAHAPRYSPCPRCRAPSRGEEPPQATALPPCPCPTPPDPDERRPFLLLPVLLPFLPLSSLSVLLSLSTGVCRAIESLSFARTSASSLHRCGSASPAIPRTGPHRRRARTPPSSCSKAKRGPLNPLFLSTCFVPFLCDSGEREPGRCRTCPRGPQACPSLARPSCSLPTNWASAHGEAPAPLFFPLSLCCPSMSSSPGPVCPRSGPCCCFFLRGRFF